MEAEAAAREAEEEAAREEERRAAEEAARLATQEAARRAHAARQAEQERLEAEEAARMEAEAAAREAEEEAAREEERRAAEEAARQATQEAARRAQAARRAEQERLEAEEAARMEAEAAAREAEEEAAREEERRAAEEAAALQAEEERQAAEEASRLAAEESARRAEAARRAELERVEAEELAARRAEEAAKAAEENERRAQQERRAAEEAARIDAEAHRVKEAPKLLKNPSTSPKLLPSLEATLKSLVPTLTKPKTVELEAGATVWKSNQDGILVWDVELVKRSEGDKYGFSHSSGKAEYLKSIGVAENAPEVDGPQVLFIRKIGVDGLLCSWNEAHGDSVVQPGDRIDKVNGKASMDQMAQELRGDKVRLEVHRYPEEFEVSLSKKASPKLGFKFEKPSNEKSRELKITEIGREGALPDQNRQMANAGRFHYVVAMGMRIIKVNSVEGDAFQMKEELRNAEEVTIKVRRQEVYALERARVMKQAQILASLSNLSGGAPGRLSNGNSVG